MASIDLATVIGHRKGFGHSCSEAIEEAVIGVLSVPSFVSPTSLFPHWHMLTTRTKLF